MYIDLLGDDVADGLGPDCRGGRSWKPQSSMRRVSGGCEDGRWAGGGADYPPNAQAPACPTLPSAMCARLAGDASASAAPWSGPGGLDAALDAQEIGGDGRNAKDPMPWDAGVWTVMIRQVPRECSQSMLVKEVNKRGYEGLWDFLYMPHDFRKGHNAGFGFLNFVEKRHAQAFRRDFDNTYLNEQMTNGGRPLRVHPAKVQGYEANYQHFRRTKAGQWTDPNFSPLFPPKGGPGGVRPGQGQAWQGGGSRGEAAPQDRALRGPRQLERADACQACGQALPSEYNCCGRCGTSVLSRLFDSEASAEVLQDFTVERQKLLMELAIVEAQVVSVQQSLRSCQVTPKSALSAYTGGTQFGVVTGQRCCSGGLGQECAGICYGDVEVQL